MKKKNQIVFILLLMGLFIQACNSRTDKRTGTNNEELTPDLKTKEALQYCEANNMNTDFCILVDMGTHSGVKRLTVWDFKKKKILKTGLVSHGCGENSWGIDETKDKPEFSNIPESHLSSLGKYAVGSRAWSNWGINVKYWLKGLESTNSNAVKRIIVLHGWESVPDNAVYPEGTPEGWGCPAVSNNMMRYLDRLLKDTKKPVLFWIYR